MDRIEPPSNVINKLNLNRKMHDFMTFHISFTFVFPQSTCCFKMDGGVKNGARFKVNWLNFGEFIGGLGLTTRKQVCY